MKGKLFTPAAAIAAALTWSPSFAANLPNGTCKGSGMTLTVQGGKIVKYKFGGTSYPVVALSASKYKIGSAGSLTVANPKEKSFKGTFSMNGRNTAATFNCN